MARSARAITMAMARPASRPRAAAPPAAAPGAAAERPHGRRRLWLLLASGVLGLALLGMGLWAWRARAGRRAKASAASSKPAPGSGERGGAAAPTTRITLVHFSDYHSHAVPFYSEHQADQAGIARTLGYLQRLRRTGQPTVVLSGGDMLNAGTPAWSDRYRCVEWSWFNGLVDAMALGNHDLDYGWEALSACRASLSYPVLSANLVGAPPGARPGPDGGEAEAQPLLNTASKPYLVKEVAGVRLGLFALAGPDFPALVKPSRLPPGARFADPLATARVIVQRLRTEERVAAVIFFGHQDRESDYRMAREVPGIDVILGSHSHYKGAFETIPGTSTVFISPYQYLNYVARVEMTFARDPGRGAPVLRETSGVLVAMDGDVTPDAQVEARVRGLQLDLERDPRYRERFAVIGKAAVELSDEGLDRGESVLGNFVLDLVRGAGQGHAALSSAGSFRASIPPGDVRLEDLQIALPYPNRALRLRLTGAQVLALLNLSASRRGSDGFAASAGLRYGLSGGKVLQASILVSTAPRETRYEPIDPLRSYEIVTTDYLASVAPGYKDLFARARSRVQTGVLFNEVVQDHLRQSSPVSAALEGRIWDVR